MRDIVVLLLDSPIIIINNNNLTVMEGEHVERKCKAEGNPEPIVTWRKASKVISGGSSKCATLMIEDTKRTSAGVYTCHAEAVSAVVGRGTLSSSEDINLIVKC